MIEKFKAYIADKRHDNSIFALFVGLKIVLLVLTLGISSWFFISYVVVSLTSWAWIIYLLYYAPKTNDEAR